MILNKSGTLFVEVDDGQKRKEAKEKLVKLAAHSTILYQTESVFPFQLFPDKVIVETDKLTLVHRTFAWKNVFPILLTNLNSVNVSRSLIFASLSVELTDYDHNPGSVSYLWPKDAAYVKRLMMGLIYAHKEGVDLSKIPVDELRGYVEEIGTTTGDSETMPMM